MSPFILPHEMYTAEKELLLLLRFRIELSDFFRLLIFAVLRNRLFRVKPLHIFKILDFGCWPPDL